MSYLSTYTTAQLFETFCGDDIDCKPVALKEMRDRYNGIAEHKINENQYIIFLINCVYGLCKKPTFMSLKTVKDYEGWLTKNGYFTTEDEKFRIDADIPEDVCSCDCHRNDCACMHCMPCCDKCYQVYIIDGMFNEGLFNK